MVSLQSDRSSRFVITTENPLWTVNDIKLCKAPSFDGYFITGVS